jgi:hypothetical protein
MLDIEIIHIWRGHIKIRVGPRTANIYGEGFFPPKGSRQPDFVVYSKMIGGWDEPYEGEIDETTREEIFDYLKKEFKERGMKLAIE